MRVIKSWILPFPETHWACDIETREEVQIPSGNEIHVIQVEGSLLVSEKVYDELLEKAKNKYNFTL